MQQLAWELRKLRELAGTPSYRSLAKRAHYSVSTLAEAAQGRRLPTLEVTLAYVEACGGDREEWAARWQEAAGLATSGPDADQGCPYPGLAAFQQRDAAWFFGRDDLVGRLVEQLEDGRGLTAVFGASGSGKSSLIRAGLLPALPEDRYPLVLTPGAHPLAELAAAVAAVTGDDPGALRERLGADPDALLLASTGRSPVQPPVQLPGQSAEQPPVPPAGESAEQPPVPSAGRPVGWPDEVRLLLVVDQFEEVFTLCADAVERSAFIGAIASVARARFDRCQVVLAVRADFYGHCSSDPNLVAALREGTQLPIGPPSEAELREIITESAAQAGLSVDADLVATLLSDAADQPGALPLLSHALRETWQRHQGSDLRLADYQASGGMRGSIAQTAERIYLGSGADRRQAIRTIFVRLTALGEGTDDTRRRIGRAELQGIAAGVDVGDLLEELARARLVVLGEDTVEVAHEAVISAWPRLRDWLIDDRSDLRTHRRLTQAAGTWAELGRDAGALMRGGQLAVVKSWAQRHPEDLNDLEDEFLGVSTAADRRRSRLTRQLIAAMATLLVLALVAAVTAARAQQSAKDQRDVALSEKAAGEAADLRKVDPALAAQLSLAAYRLSPTVAARSSLMSSFAAPFATRLTHEINTTAFTPDGRIMATGGDDRTIRLWDVTAPHRPSAIAVLPGQPDDVESLSVSLDARTMVSANYDGTVRLWDISEPRRPALRATLAAHKEAVFRAPLSPDARTLATASADGNVRLWDLSQPGAPTRLAELTGHTATVGTAAFSPDGKTLATGSDDGTARLWSVGDPRRARSLARLPRQESAITSVAFGPDGRTLAAAGYDHKTRLWDVAKPRDPVALATLSGHAAPLQAVTFSPDGRTLATGGWDYTARLWDVSEPRHPRPLTTLSNHTNTIWSLTFSPNGRILASASSDHSALLTDVPGPLMAGHDGALSTAALSPDGRSAVVGSEDFTARLWDVHESGHPGPLSVLRGHTGQVKAVAFSGSGRIVATGSIDTTVGLWDVSDPRRPVRLGSLKTGVEVRTVAFMPGDGILASAGGGVAEVELWDVSDPRRPEPAGIIKQNMGSISVAFSPRGRLLAVVQDYDVHLWNVTDPHRPVRVAEFAAHPDTIQKLVFSPDGRRLATAGLDGTARLWDVADPARPRALATMTGHVGGVQSVAFSPDGRALATAGLDGTARLWDLDGGSTVGSGGSGGGTAGVGGNVRPVLRAVLNGHSDRVHAVAFGPDGRTVLTSSEDRTARLWNTDPEQVAAQVCAVAHSRITRREWDRYFPGVGYRPPCAGTS